jgi:hypothetical protein
VPEYLKAREGKLRDRSLVEVTRYLAGTKYRKTGNARTPAAFKALHKTPNRHSQSTRLRGTM